MSISSSVGLISGINYEDIISKITAVNQRPISQLMTRQSQHQQKISAYTALNRKLVALNDALDTLRDTSDFQRITATSSDNKVMTVSAADGAVAGSYSVEVKQLAAAERRVAQGVDSTDSIIASGGGGAFIFQVGDGEVASVTVDAGMTLQQLRAAINDADAGVTASIVNDGSETGSRRLVLTVNETGAENTLNILTNNTLLNFSKSIAEAEADAGNTFAGTATASGTYTGTGSKQFVVEMTTGGAIGDARFRLSTDGGQTWGADDAFTTDTLPVALADGVSLAFGGASSFAIGDRFSIDATDPTLQQAQDAIVEIDGIEVRRASNTIEDAIENVTLTAASVSDDPVTIRVSSDNQNVVGPINQFVLAYNDLVKSIASLTSYDSETQQASVLFGDSTIRAIRSQLSAIITSPVSGMSNDRINTLAEAGISLSRDGTLSVDSAKLNSALTSNPDDIAALFAVAGTQANESLSFQGVTGTVSRGGSYQVQVVTPGQQAKISGANLIAPGGLTADETLTFTVDDVNFGVILKTGDTLEELINKINARMEEEEVSIVAYDDDGKLGLRTEAYGSTEKIEVASSLAGAGQTGLSTTKTTATGVDVVGSINGIQATGSGRILTGATGSTVAGIQIEVLATAAGNAGSIDVSFGIAEQLAQALATITDDENGLIKTRTDGLNATIESINDRMTTLQTRINSEAERLRAQFRAMETQLASLQSEGSFLLNSLAGISSIRA